MDGSNLSIAHAVDSEQACVVCGVSATQLREMPQQNHLGYGYEWES